MKGIGSTLTFTFTLLAIAVSAQQVTQDEAAQVANSFFKSQGKTFSKCAKTVGDGNSTLLYIFNAENAFAVVAGDKSAVPILAFIDSQTYSDSDTIAPFNMWISNYAEQISRLRRCGGHLQQNTDRWAQLLAGEDFENNNEIAPLVESRWDQGEFYNYYCPKDAGGPNGRVVTGCVATAMAQLIYYFRFPESGVGEYSYADANYGQQYANYGEATYDYNAMCDVPTSINTEISKLIYHCGVGVDMVYGPNGSGMYNHSAAKVLRTHFKFSPETQYLFRDSTDLNWDSVIVSHLEKKIPLYYAGWSVPNINGHGFICDGYKMVDSNYYYHFNFGWSGYMDGFFYTDNLLNFNLAQELIINAYPDTNLYQYPVLQQVNGHKNLTAKEGTFTDGSLSHENYAKNMDFTWNIVPDVNNVTSVSAKIRYKIAEGDTLRIFSNDPDITDGFTLTADTGSVDFEWPTWTITIRLTSDSIGEDVGFRAHYTANVEQFCGGTQMFYDPNGTIEDGSGSAEYNHFSDCHFRLMFTQYNNVIIHINWMDLEEGHDYLHFYKNIINENNMILSLTGTLSDTTFVIEANRLSIKFVTDDAGSGDGFSLDYEASHTGIDNFGNNISISPNPAKDLISISYSENINRVEIFGNDGRRILVQDVNAESGTIGISNLTPGIYTLKIFSGLGFYTKKIVKI